MSSCQIGQAVDIIYQNIKFNPSIIYLDLSSNLINDEYFIEFQDYPLVNEFLIELDMSNNLISDKSAKKFFENLANNISLQKLNFCDNQLGRESGLAILDILHINKKITYLNITLNKIGFLLQRKINAELNKNRIFSKEKKTPQLKQEIKELDFKSSEFITLKDKILRKHKETFSLIKTLETERKRMIVNKEQLKLDSSNHEKSMIELDNNIKDFKSKLTTLIEGEKEEGKFFYKENKMKIRVSTIQREINRENKQQQENMSELNQVLNKLKSKYQDLCIKKRVLDEKLNSAKIKLSEYNETYNKNINFLIKIKNMKK